MPEMTILLVEDNKDILNINTRFLEMRGYRVVQAETCADALKAFAEERPNLVVLDIMLPDGDGISLCRKIRETSSVPVLFLTCKGEEEEIVTGLTVGGDDYLLKPYNLEEFGARILAQLRRSQLQDVVTISYPPLTVNTRTHQAFMNGEDACLSKKEFQMLLLLVKNVGKAFTPEEISLDAWGQEPYNIGQIVRVHISSLRKKLGLDNDGPVRIAVQYGKGYSFHWDKDEAEAATEN